MLRCEGQTLCAEFGAVFFCGWVGLVLLAGKRGIGLEMFLESAALYFFGGSTSTPQVVCASVPFSPHHIIIIHFVSSIILVFVAKYYNHFDLVSVLSSLLAGPYSKPKSV